MRSRLRQQTRMLIAAIVIGSISACSAASSYSILSFFFDGVPDPNAPVVMGPEYKPGSNFRALTLEERAELQRQRLVQVKVYSHKPWDEKKCNECHKISMRPKDTPGGSSWMQGLPELLLPKEKLCLKCHEVPKEKYVHGPVATGNCAYCHDPHQSLIPHLVKVKRVADLCNRCHQGPTFTTSQQHEAVSEQPCTQCHNPHSSDKAVFLKPGAGALIENVGPRRDPRN